jgi:hypothetical protein
MTDGNRFLSAWGIAPDRQMKAVAKIEGAPGVISWRAFLVLIAGDYLPSDPFVFPVTPWMKGRPFGSPKPVTLSQPGVTVSDESVPKLSTKASLESRGQMALGNTVCE